MLVTLLLVIFLITSLFLGLELTVAASSKNSSHHFVMKFLTQIEDYG